MNDSLMRAASSAAAAASRRFLAPSGVHGDEGAETLALNGRDGRARQVIKRLDDPADTALPALEALLSYAEVRVTSRSACWSLRTSSQAEPFSCGRIDISSLARQRRARPVRTRL